MTTPDADPTAAALTERTRQLGDRVDELLAILAIHNALSEAGHPRQRFRDLPAAVRELTRQRDEAVRELARHQQTFTIRPAGETEDVTVALHSLGACTICGNELLAGAFVVRVTDRSGIDDARPWPKAWAHESCAHPGKPARPALNADQTRNRS